MTAGNTVNEIDPLGHFGQYRWTIGAAMPPACVHWAETVRACPGI